MAEGEREREREPDGASEAKNNTAHGETDAHKNT